MTMDPINEQFEAVVLPALAEYLEAEAGLSAALAVSDAAALAAARQLLMRRARTAATELHQFADFAAAESGAAIDVIRAAVAAHCTFLRTTNPVTDIALLRDTAEAFKHHQLSRANGTVTGSDAIVGSATGYSMLFYGEGKYGGTEQVVVTAKDKTQRALSSILQNAADAWRRHLGRALPAIGDYST
jgi:hypothetical protein